MGGVGNDFTLYRVWTASRVGMFKGSSMQFATFICIIARHT